MVKLTDLLFPGKEEAELLLGLTEPEEIADTFLKLGVQTVALKLGKSGCYVKNKETEAFVHGYTVDHPVDTVGAGDGYAAGFISGYLENLSLTECAQRANAVGAMATLVKGDMEGFPYKDQVEIFMGLKNSIDR